jgi:hypothetical protein
LQGKYSCSAGDLCLHSHRTEELGQCHDEGGREEKASRGRVIRLARSCEILHQALSDSVDDRGASGTEESGDVPIRVECDVGDFSEEESEREHRGKVREGWRVRCC